LSVDGVDDPIWVVVQLSEFRGSEKHKFLRYIASIWQLRQRRELISEADHYTIGQFRRFVFDQILSNISKIAFCPGGQKYFVSHCETILSEHSAHVQSLLQV